MPSLIEEDGPVEMVRVEINRLEKSYRCEMCASAEPVNFALVNLDEGASTAGLRAKNEKSLPLLLVKP